MIELPSRAALADLTARVTDVVAVATTGFARALDDARVSVLFVDSYGLREYVVGADELPESLRFTGDPLQTIEHDVVVTDPPPVIEWHWRFAGAMRVVSLPVPSMSPPMRFCVGLAAPGPLTAAQRAALEDIAASTAAMWQDVPTADDMAERLRRLELTAAWLPALRRVLDVREIFEHLSTIGKAALPHDMLALGLYNEDLTTYTAYAMTGSGPQSTGALKNPYPPSAVRAWTFDIIDDRAQHPLDRDRPATHAGAKSSIRFSMEVDNRVFGGLGINASRTHAFSTADVAVGRRLADCVAVALSHHRLAEQLAEQARQNELLRARAAQADLLDDVLDSLTGEGDLREVFTRISQATQRVLPHDALVLTVRLPDGRRGKVYASAGGSTPFPDTLDVPPPLLANPDWQYDLVDDLRDRDDQRHLWIAQHGYRGALRLPVRLDNAFVAGVSFLSTTPRKYTDVDVPVARRIVEKIALRFARERGAALLKQADEASERVSRLEARVRALTDELDARTGYRRVVGESPQWRQVLTQATQVAATDTTVLLLGESGTGKEVIARFLHRASSRDHGPFIALNCAALPEQLLEAELFGYERGAYTGATQTKPGQLEQAAGGTLFLDEVAEMSPSAQAKFLRVLQEREFQRLGGTRILRTDARIVAATNRDLAKAIANNQFREDLYYRLNVFAIRLPALRDRRDDIVPLSEAFLAEIGRGLGRPPGGISRDARAKLVEHHWPGNVRELRNVLERAAILCDGGLITPAHLELAVPAASVLAAAAPLATATVPELPSSASHLQSLERDMIAQALQTARFNKSKASKALGLTRQQLYLRMRKYGLE
jgi:transcriptional regulator with GAF, ATPase, and Fis domain